MPSTRQTEPQVNAFVQTVQSSFGLLRPALQQLTPDFGRTSDYGPIRAAMPQASARVLRVSRQVRLCLAKRPEKYVGKYRRKYRTRCIRLRRQLRSSLYLDLNLDLNSELYL